MTGLSQNRERSVTATRVRDSFGTLSMMPYYLRKGTMVEVGQMTGLRGAVLMSRFVECGRYASDAG